MFEELGVDILFLEAPQSEEEMAKFCDSLPGPKMANMVEQGDTPILPPARLEELGFKIAAYPLTLLSASIRAMREALGALGKGEPPERILDFMELREAVGFDEYDRGLARYDKAP
jgi:2-methylisocitrate lyase-like PEP mutase family enzyme